MSAAVPKLHEVKVRGKLRGYRLYLGQKYQSFHATKKEAWAAKKECKSQAVQKQQAMWATKKEASRPPAPLVHYTGLVSRYLTRKGKWIFEGRLRVRGTENKKYVGSGDMTAVAKNIVRARGEELAQCKRKRKTSNTRGVREEI